MHDWQSLITTFEKNAILCAQENERLLKKFQEENLGEPIPEWFTRDFCINTALAAMCKEILHLKTLGNSEGWSAK